MKAQKIFKRLMLGILAVSLASTADDIDLYAVNAANAGTPNIIFMLDNSANWNSTIAGETQRLIIHKSLYQFFQALKTTVGSGPNDPKFKLAFMPFRIGTGSLQGGSPVQSFILVDSVAALTRLQNLLYCKPRTSGAPLSGYANLAAENAACKAQIGQDWPATYSAVDSFVEELFYNRSEKIEKGNNAPMGLAFHEALLYFGGEKNSAGYADGPRADIYNPNGYDPDAFQGITVTENLATGAYAASGTATAQTLYESPINGQCTKNAIIFVSNGAPDSSDSNATAQAVYNTKLGPLGLNNNSVVLNTFLSQFQNSGADEYAKIMANNDVNKNIAGDQYVDSYVIDVFKYPNDPATGVTYDWKKLRSVKTNSDLPPGLNANTAAAHRLLISIGDQGKGGYTSASDSAALVKALQQSLGDILARNTVFAASSLPVSVNERGVNLNEVYMGLFRPAKTARWNGNLKLYQVGGTPRRLVDSTGNDAEDLTNGFIKDSAISYWTHNSTYWTPASSSSFLSGTGFVDYDLPENKELLQNLGGRSPISNDSPDGKTVERGGAAQIHRDLGPAGRNITTCVTCILPTLEPFNETNLNILFTAAADNLRKTKIVRWVRGFDEGSGAAAETAGDVNKNGSMSDLRPYAHGAVIHSKPAVINYGGTRGVVVFYGAEDGLLRAVQAGKTATSPSVAGQELWAFVAPEHYDSLVKLYDNTGFASTTSFKDKPVFMDGSISSFVKYTTGPNPVPSKAYIYVTPRRGGKFIYAFDVTNPLSPTLMWKRSKTSTGFGELGQAWSQPVVTKMNISTINTLLNPDKLVLVMGLGYDKAADDDGAARTEGRGVVVLDAITGAKLWETSANASTASSTFHKPTMGSVPAAIAVLNRDFAVDSFGYADRFYWGDTNGQLWRADVKDTNTSNWTVTKLLKVGTGAQKFLFTPDIAISDGVPSTFDAVLIGTGDREKPFNTTTRNYFIVYKDYDQYVSSSVTSATMRTIDASLSTTCAAGPTSEAPQGSGGYDLYQLCVEPDTNTTRNIDVAMANTNFNNYGWYLPMESGGEKSVGKALTLNSVVYFNTNTPGNNTASCNDLGKAKLYALNPFTLVGQFTGEKNWQESVAGGFTPDPTVGYIDFDPNSTADKPEEVICAGAHCFPPDATFTGARTRKWWYNNLDD